MIIKEFDYQEIEQFRNNFYFNKIKDVFGVFADWLDEHDLFVQAAWLRLCRRHQTLNYVSKENMMVSIAHTFPSRDSGMVRITEESQFLTVNFSGEMYRHGRRQKEDENLEREILNQLRAIK